MSYQPSSGTVISHMALSWSISVEKDTIVSIPQREADQLRVSVANIYENAINQTRAGRIQELGQQHQVNTAAIVLSYLMSQSFPVFPVIGASDLEQLTDSLIHIDLRLSAEEITYLEHTNA